MTYRGVKQSRFKLEPETEDFAFVRQVAGGVSLTSTEIFACDTFLKLIKPTISLSNVLAAYPFVGSSATGHSLNLISSSYQITWGGTITHNASGVTGNGSTGFGNTGILNSSLGQTGGYAIYTPAITSAGYVVSCRDDSKSVFCGLQLGVPTNYSNFYFSSTSGVTAAFNTFNGGAIGGQRLSATELRIYEDGVSKALSSTSSTVGTTNSTIYLLCLYRYDTDSKSQFCAQNIRFCVIHKDLNGTQKATLDNAMLQAQIMLGRST